MSQRILHKAAPAALIALFGHVGPVGVSPVSAQEAGGVLATFGVSAGYRFEDSSTDDTVSLPSISLSFGLESSTASRRASLETGGQVVLRDDGIAFENPSAALAYTYAMRRAEMGVSLSYAEAEITGGTLIDDVILDETGAIEGFSLVVDEGTQQSMAARAFLTTGQGGPFGTDTSLRFQQVDYRGLIAGDLDDRETIDFNTTLRFDVSPQVTLRLTGRFSETDEDDAEQTLRTSTGIGASATFVIDPLWTADVGVQQSRIETATDDGLGGRTVETSEGLDVDLGVTRRFSNGDLTLSFSQDITRVGTWNRLNVSRQMALGNGADLQVGVGAVAFETDTVLPLFQLSYAQPTQNGRLSLSLQQTPQIRDDADVVRTSVAAGYSHTLSPTRSMSLDGSFSAQDFVGVGTGDQQSFQIGLGYNHAVTTDWDFVTRMSHRQIFEDGVADREVSTLSLTLERQFSFRP